jgi:hypothetical protein
MLPSPVPPRVPPSVPVHPGLKVCVLPEETMERVMLVSLVVAKVWESGERPLSEVMPVSVKERQVPFTA